MEPMMLKLLLPRMRILPHQTGVARAEPWRPPAWNRPGASFSFLTHSLLIMGPSWPSKGAAAVAMTFLHLGFAQMHRRMCWLPWRM